MDNIKPYGRNLLIEPIIKSSVLIQEKNTMCEYGKVIAIGDEVKSIKVGDTVGFLIFGINGLEVEDKTLYFLPEDDRFLLGTFEING